MDISLLFKYLACKADPVPVKKKKFPVADKIEDKNPSENPTLSLNPLDKTAMKYPLIHIDIMYPTPTNKIFSGEILKRGSKSFKFATKYQVNAMSTRPLAIFDIIIFTPFCTL